MLCLFSIHSILCTNDSLQILRARLAPSNQFKPPVNTDRSKVVVMFWFYVVGFCVVSPYVCIYNFSSVATFWERAAH